MLFTHMIWFQLMHIDMTTPLTYLGVPIFHRELHLKSQSDIQNMLFEQKKYSLKLSSYSSQTWNQCDKKQVWK